MMIFFPATHQDYISHVRAGGEIRQSGSEVIIGSPYHKMTLDHFSPADELAIVA
jgi:hypothetical protein